MSEAVAGPRQRQSYGFGRRDQCPACGSGEVETRYRCGFAQPPIGEFIANYFKIDPAALAAGEYRIDQCRRCGLAYQAEVGSPELLDDLYSHWVEDFEDPERDFPVYGEDVRHPRLSRDGHEIMAAASYLRRPLSDLVTLDYGMGFALWARIAAQLGCRSYGSDLAQARMAFARRYGVETVTDAEIAPQSFDFINTEQVFEHVPDPHGLMQRLAAALKPGGVIKVSVPRQRDMDELVALLPRQGAQIAFEKIMPILPLEHVNCFTPTAVTVLGERSGLELVKPGLRHSYAFLGTAGAIDPRKPKKAVKELVRPWYQWRSPSNLYQWLRKPKTPAAGAAR
jgi:2-polyprenyl-3-methyl-5-hydroxy-6-metoxy-1,4-benzoquinol methylase